MALRRQRGVPNNSAIEPASRFGARSRTVGLGRGLPLFGFLEATADQDRQQRGGHADYEHPAPGPLDRAGLLEVAEDHADHGGDHVADGRHRLHQPQSVRSGAVGDHLGDQRDPDGELAADAQPGQEPVKSEVPDPHGQGTQAGEGRVGQDRHQHRLGPADPVAEHAEEQTPGRPADHEDHGGVTTVFRDLLRAGSVARRGPQQLGDGGLARQVKELLIHRVEHPAERRHDQDEPVIRGQRPGPRLTHRRTSGARRPSGIFEVHGEGLQVGKRWISAARLAAVAGGPIQRITPRSGRCRTQPGEISFGGPIDSEGVCG